MNKQKFKRMLKLKTGCSIQYNGWCCGTCFFSLSKKLDNKDWRSLLYYRGDYGKEELDLIPENWEERINKIWELIK